tara:strand:+ start:7356 stop:7925 length:570 start_codon:yes stop_codon:yes gene_type:complete
MGESNSNEDILRVMGFIGFVSILVGSAVAVFDAGLWLRSDETYGNAMTYAMGAFTLQGMSFFFYKLLVQESMDSKAQWTRQQRVRDNRMRDMQSQFANAQLEQELSMRKMQMDKQLSMMNKNPDAFMAMMGGNSLGILDDHYKEPVMFDDSTADFNPPPKHKIDDKKPVNLGVDYGEEDENKGAKKGAK